MILNAGDNGLLHLYYYIAELYYTGYLYSIFYSWEPAYDTGGCTKSDDIRMDESLTGSVSPLIIESVSHRILS